MRLFATAISIVSLCALVATAQAEPRYYMQGIPGAICAPSNKLDSDDLYVYQDRALANTAEETGQFFLAKCALSELAADMRLLDVRVRMTGPKSRQPQCVTFDIQGEQVHSADAERSDGEWRYWFGSGEIGEAPIDEQINLTVYCLLPSDSRIERIDLVWERI